MLNLGLLELFVHLLGPLPQDVVLLSQALPVSNLLIRDQHAYSAFDDDVELLPFVSESEDVVLLVEGFAGEDLSQLQHLLLRDIPLLEKLHIFEQVSDLGKVFG